MIVSWRAINKVQHGTDPNAACQPGTKWGCLGPKLVSLLIVSWARARLQGASRAVLVFLQRLKARR